MKQEHDMHSSPAQNANKTKPVKKGRFRGWYFKHQLPGGSVAFIPGYQIAADGTRSAFLQIITIDRSEYIAFPYEAFSWQKSPLRISLGNNVFSADGIDLDVQTPSIKIEATLRYGVLAPLKKNIMGFYRFLPFMECRHGVISMYHAVSGKVTIDGMPIFLHDTCGYIETDWGRSFPKSYLWTHCGTDSCGTKSVMLSVARIPYLGREFWGVIASVIDNKKEYRIATYRGAKIKTIREGYAEIIQHKYRLVFEAENEDGQELLAPQDGKMDRLIRENISTLGHYRLFYEYIFLFGMDCERASYEYVE